MTQRSSAVASVVAIGLGAFLFLGCSPAQPTMPSSHTPGMVMSPDTSMSGMGASHTPGRAGEMKMGVKGVDALKALHGRDFDIAFLSQMMAHHEAAILMAKQALSVASKPETKAEAQKVIDAQSKEIAQMTYWLKQWYNTQPTQNQQNLVREDMRPMLAMPVGNDQMFYIMMIPHHQGAIDMSELAASRAEKTEVKSMADKIIQDQKADIGKYKTLL